MSAAAGTGASPPGTTPVGDARRARRGRRAATLALVPLLVVAGCAPLGTAGLLAAGGLLLARSLGRGDFSLTARALPTPPTTWPAFAVPPATETRPAEVPATPTMATPTAWVSAAPGPRTAGAPTPTPTAVPAVDWPELPEVGGREPLLVTAHFLVHADPPDDEQVTAVARRWAPRLEAILAPVEARAGRTLQAPVHVVFARAYQARCPARGLAAPRHDPPLIVVYVDARTPAAQVHGVLAHEMAHHVSDSEDFTQDGILVEGVANWLAEPAMLAWLGLESWDHAVRDAVARGHYASLVDPTALSPRPGEDCIERRDRVYALRTSFVAWLIQHWGLDTVLAMPETAVPDPDAPEQTLRRPDYAAATGRTLASLELEWLEHVLRGGDMAALAVSHAPAEGAYGDS